MILPVVLERDIWLAYIPIFFKDGVLRQIDKNLSLYLCRNIN